jgi:hypothetical protein
MFKCLAADVWWATRNIRVLSERLLTSVAHMDETSIPRRAEFLQRLQALAQHAAADDSLPLPQLADQLATLAEQMRAPSNVNGEQ